MPFYDYRNRIYSPELGRFLQTDPIRFGHDVNIQKEGDCKQKKPNPKSIKIEDVNFYRYVRNNSINLIDPTGETPAALILIGIFAFFTLANELQDQLDACDQVEPGDCETFETTVSAMLSGYVQDYEVAVEVCVDKEGNCTSRVVVGTPSA